MHFSLKFGGPTWIRTKAKNLEDSCDIHFTMGPKMERREVLETSSSVWKTEVIPIYERRLLVSDREFGTHYTNLA